MSQPSLFSEHTVRFSDDRRYRYSLAIAWRTGTRVVNFLMLNPSTADEVKNDPTVERCERRARSRGYDGLVITNLFALRATDPRELLRSLDPIGPENDAAILTAALGSDLVICAWGNYGRILDRSRKVLKLLLDAGIQLHCLKLGQTVEPAQPLYFPYELTPKAWDQPSALLNA